MFDLYCKLNNKWKKN